MQQADQHERDEQFCNVVMAFIRAKESFDEQLAHYRATGQMDFPKLDNFVEEVLYNLKEDCHFLFRKQRYEPCMEMNSESLFDISVGSIFHELMKIKENVYQLSYYAPLYTALLRSPERGTYPQYERAFLEACDKIVRRARRTLPSDLKAAEELFRDATDNLKIMLRRHISNVLLPRMLLDNEERVNRVFGTKNIDELLIEIYSGKLDEAHLTATRDYLSGGWYEKARQEAERVLEIDAENLEALQIISKLSGKAAAKERIETKGKSTA